MKATGVVREIDDLGRITLPKAIRKVLDLPARQSCEFFVADDSIIIKKYNPGCIFCGDCAEITKFNGKNVCEKCRDKLSR